MNRCRVVQQLSKALNYALERLRQGLVRRSGLFDEAFYKDAYPDVVESGVAPLRHYCRIGWREGRRPGPEVQPRSFGSSHAGAILRGGNPIIRWMLLGRWLGWSLSWRQLLQPGSAPEKVGKQLVLVVHEASRTGAPIFALRLARWLRRAGCEPSIVLLDDGALLPQLWEEFDCLPLFALSPSERRPALEAHLAACDLLYINSVAALAVLRFLPELHCETLLHVHESAATLGNWISELEQLAEKRPVVITVDRHGAAMLQELLRARVEVIPPAIELPPTCSELHHRPMVVGCGTMSHRKGADLFCRVAKRLSHRSDVDLVWIGGPGDVDMEALLNRMDLAARVRLVGEVVDARVYFRDASLLLLTSRDDPFPLVALEAASCAVPVICFEALREGVGSWVSAGAGIIVPSFDVDAMAEAAFELLNQSNLRRSAGRKGRSIAQEFGIDKIGPQIGAVINDKAGQSLILCSEKRSSATSRAG